MELGREIVLAFAGRVKLYTFNSVAFRGSL